MHLRQVILWAFGLSLFPIISAVAYVCFPAVSFVKRTVQQDSECRGVIRGNPVCTDTNWSLAIGVYKSTNAVAGTFVPPGAAAGYTKAVLMSIGFGSLVTTEPPTASSGMTPTPVVTATRSSPGSTATRKAVFFHYMVGNITDEHCRQDIIDAKALGADAFALNINTVTQSWATDTVTSLFNWANTLDFKLFFSFDMTGFSHPNQFISYLQSYITNPAHYKYNGLPFVSTFNGGAAQYTFGQASVNDGWNVQLQQVMANTGHPIYFVPAFQDVPITSSFYSTFPTLNGAMNWDAWPQDTQGNIVVPVNLDQTLQVAGKSAGKTFLMGVSPVQFKHIDGESNWYRRGEQNLEYRIGQVLSLQPDFIEIQSWNDAGESHYMGNSWLEPILGTPIVDYTQAYDHTAYKEILPAFIKAFKDGVTTTAALYPTNGAAAQGTFWHHTLLAAGTCPSDPLGLPRGASTVENKVTAVVLVAAGQTGLQAILTSGSTTLGTQNLVAGFNGFSFGGMTTGSVSVRVINSVGTTLVSGTGPIAVVSTATLCNYNFQVVGLH